MAPKSILLKTFLRKTNVKMSLVQNGIVIDFKTTSYYHDLSELLTPLEVADIIKKGFVKKGGVVIYGELLTGLISALDKLLKRNKLDVKTLKSYKIISNLGKNSTSYKIAAAFIEGLKTKG
jgi:hypothetical protein